MSIVTGQAEMAWPEQSLLKGGVRMALSVRPLSASDGQDIYQMLQEIPEDENGFTNPLHGSAYTLYRAWLIREEESSRSTQIEDGWRVPQTTYWLYADGVPVGMARLRHMLTDKLLQNGGSIGYCIRPGYRGRGYGKALLEGVLREAWNMGLDRVLITVHSGNTPSIRTALANGGAVEAIRNGMHYIWISRPAENQG